MRPRPDSRQGRTARAEAIKIWTDVEWLVEAPGRPAESPVWDAERQCVWWVDIMLGHLHRFDRRTGRDDVFEVGEAVGAVGLAAYGRLVLALAGGVELLDPDHRRRQVVARFEEDPRLRCNDAKPGPDGALWVGRMALGAVQAAGAFKRVTPAGQVDVLVDRTTISNGMDWESPTRLYWTDSISGRVDVLTWDRKRRIVAARTPFIAIDPQDGVPDGMTLDRDGNLWLAVHDAGEVRRYRPDGMHDATVRVPVRAVTSCAFGGPDLDELYITVAGEEGRDGGLCRAAVGAAGRPAFRFGARGLSSPVASPASPASARSAPVPRPTLIGQHRFPDSLQRDDRR